MLRKKIIFLLLITYLGTVWAKDPTYKQHCYKTHSETIAKGLSWHRYLCFSYEASIGEAFVNVLSIDLKSNKVVPVVNKKLMSLAEMAKKHPKVIAAINGGFYFRKDQVPFWDNICPKKTNKNVKNLGNSLLQIDGKVIATNCDNNGHGKSHFARSVMVLSGKGAPYIRLVSPNKIVKGLAPHEPLPNVIGAGPNLISYSPNHGAFINIVDEGFPWVNEKKPRAAIAIKRNPQRILMVTLDSLIEDKGVTLHTFAKILKNVLHVDAALNLDGGGSTSIYLKKSKHLKLDYAFKRRRPIHDAVVVLPKH